MREPLLKIQDLKVYYPVKKQAGSFRVAKQYVKAVDGVSLDVYQGEVLGLVGESGCGKSTTGKAIVRLIKPTAGQILFEGQDLFMRRDRAATRALAQKIQLIFQDPYSSLDPQFTVGRTIGEPLVVFGGLSKEERRRRVLELMAEVGLREEHYDKHPHEFSGGQRQRIGVARSLALHPSLIVCDEPVSALDVSIQAQILNLMKALQEKHNLTYIFISHNLSVVRHISNRIAVMYLGHVVEIADKQNLFDHPSHPYTQALLEAIPAPDPTVQSMQETLEGDVPSPIDPPKGCCFHTRCKHASERCSLIAPRYYEVEPGHQVACHLFDQ